jgi:hypothetical protein
MWKISHKTFTQKCTRQMSITGAPSRGRALLDYSNCVPDEILLNSDATEELCQKVQLPTFHEVMLAWDNYRIDANLQWADM